MVNVCQVLAINSLHVQMALSLPICTLQLMKTMKEAMNGG